jgi:hypothetical protein
LVFAMRSTEQIYWANRKTANAVSQVREPGRSESLHHRRRHHSQRQRDRRDVKLVKHWREIIGCGAIVRFDRTERNRGVPIKSLVIRRQDV